MRELDKISNDPLINLLNAITNRVRKYKKNDPSFQDCDDQEWFTSKEKKLITDAIGVQRLTPKSLSRYLQRNVKTWNVFTVNDDAPLIKAIIDYRVFRTDDVWRILLVADDVYHALAEWRKIGPVFAKLIEEGEMNHVSVPEKEFTPNETRILKLLATQDYVRKLPNGNWVYTRYLETLKELADRMDAGKIEVRFGYAGSGKTTRTFKDLPDDTNLLLLSLGHKLKKENKEKAIAAGCKTVESHVIARLRVPFGINWWGFETVVVDESTLLGIEEIDLILNQIRFDQKIIFLGDYRQMTNFTSRGCIFYSMCERAKARPYTDTPHRHKDDKFNKEVLDMMTYNTFDLDQIASRYGKKYLKEEEFWEDCTDHADDEDHVLLAIANRTVGFSEILYYTKKTDDTTYLEMYHKDPEKIQNIVWKMHGHVMQMTEPTRFRATCRSNLNKYGIPNGASMHIETGETPRLVYEDKEVEIAKLLKDHVIVNFNLGMGSNIFNSQGQGYRTVWWMDDSFRSSNATYVALTRTIENINIYSKNPRKWTTWSANVDNFQECGI